MSRHLDSVDQEIEYHEDQLRLLRNQRKALLDEAAPFKVGDVVEASRYNRTDGHTWDKAIVRSVEHTLGGPWYRVSFARKNGEWRRDTVATYDRVRPLGEK